ncbi:MAG: aminopeptidase P family protein [Dehalococcoidia bacterium]|nr:aminopeptidase P family protein [Dehalococcoidia bacterium]
MTSRVDKIHRRLFELQLDAVFISQPLNRRYLSGFTGSAGYIFISQKDTILATDFRYVEQSKAQSPDFEVFQISGDFTKWFPQLVSDTNSKRIGFESDYLTLSAYRQLVKAAKKLRPISRPQLIPTQGVVESLRAIKDSDEIRLMEAAARIADAAEEHAVKILRPGMTEKELSWNLERFMREEGSESLPFEIIVASGANSALPHAQPTNREIMPGEPVVIDLGAKVNGYTSDITRTICLGEPSERFASIYRIVYEAQLSALQKICTGMSGEKADSVAREVIAKAGYGEKFGHGLGHGVGLETHELPRLGKTSTDILSEGMVCTVEPGIYLEGWGGVRIEDMVVLDKKIPRVLTQARKLVIGEGS